MRNALKFFKHGIFLLLYSLASYSFANPEPAIKKTGFIFERAPFESCHASTIVQTKTGFLAAWFGGSYEGAPDVQIWTSRYENGLWSPPLAVAKDHNALPTWNPVLFKPRQGPLMLFYKVGPAPHEWWGMFMTSLDEGLTWSEPKHLPVGFLGPIKNKPVELSDGSILAPSSIESEKEGLRVHLEISKDGDLPGKK